MMRKPFELLKSPWLSAALGIAFFFLSAVALLWSNIAEGGEPRPAIFPEVYLQGEYRIGDGAWNPIIQGEHIPSTEGDVTLRGVFHMHFPDLGEKLGPVGAGIPIAFFMDHIGITVYESGREPHVMDNENPLFGVTRCSQAWLGYSLSADGVPVELVIHNPHRFGNERAVDDFLANLAVWVSVDFDRDILSQGAFQRNCAAVFIVIAFAFLGTALFSSVLRIKNSSFIWLIGMSVLFAGIYLLFSSNGISFWSRSDTLNTTVLCSSVMAYTLIVSLLAAFALERFGSVGRAAVTLLIAADTAAMLISTVSDVFIYDTLWAWAAVQGTAGILLAALLIYESLRIRRADSIFKFVLALLLLGFAFDMFGVRAGFWKGGLTSSYLFVGALMFALVFVLQVVPQNLAALSKAKESELQRVHLEAEKSAIEAELKESRISTMLSQIQPHFIYNTLGTIERLCLKSPEMASELVRNFSLYLRGNFSELDSIAPIRFSQEIRHVEHYVNIEKVRFPDMNIEYCLEASDFVLPALSVQPLVENAIKHGLMQLETGGTVRIHSYETQTHFCVDVWDNGGGFDTSEPINKKEHVGLYNIRERLMAIVNGTLSIQSEIGVGTTASIRIPKEDTV